MNVWRKENRKVSGMASKTRIEKGSRHAAQAALLSIFLSAGGYHAFAQQDISPATSGITDSTGKHSPRIKATEVTDTKDGKKDTFFSRKYLLGDWDGVRTKLEQKGIVFDFYYQSDPLASLSGGYETANGATERVRGTIDINFEKMHVVKGLTFHATGLWQAGVNLGSQYIGTLSNPTSLPSAPTTRLDSMWLQQSLFADKLFLRAGQIALYDCYNVREYGVSFVNEPMGYAPYTLHNVYASYNPGGTPAAEVRVQPIKNAYIKAVIAAGNRDPYSQDPSGFHFTIKDSPVFAFETGYYVEPQRDTGSAASVLGKQAKYGEGIHPGVYKFGAAYNPGRFTNPTTGGSGLGNYLVWFQGNQAIYRVGRVGVDARRGIDVTVQVNGSPSDVNQVNLQADAGVRFLGPFAKRPDDSFSVGYVFSHVSSNFNTLATETRPAIQYGQENEVEVNYLFHINQWAYIQPVYEFISSPGGRSTHRLGDSSVVGFRAKVTF